MVENRQLPDRKSCKSNWIGPYPKSLRQVSDTVVRDLAALVISNARRFGELAFWSTFAQGVVGTHHYRQLLELLYEHLERDETYVATELANKQGILRRCKRWLARPDSTVST